LATYQSRISQNILYAFLTTYILFGSSLRAQQAWAPYQRQLWFRPAFVHSEYNSAYLANAYAKYDDNVRITAGAATFEYGITDRLTLDASSGFGKLGRHRIFNPLNPFRPQTPESPDKYGVLDSRAGIRYRIVDEFDSKYRWMPTISVRVGGIKKGDYDRNPQALGDGANGIEANLYFAKDFDFFGLGTIGEVSYRKRERPVPEDIVYHGSIYKRFFESIYLFTGTRGQIGQGGFGYFDPRQQPPYNLFELKPFNDQFVWNGINLYDWYVRDFRPPWGRRESFQNLEIGLGYMDSYGNFWNIFYSETINGFNTADLRTIGFVVNMPYNI